MSKHDQVTDQIEKSTICRNFISQVERTPYNVALNWKQDDEWQSLSYSELRDLVGSVASSLSHLGIGSGDRVLMMLTNRFEFHVIDLAVVFLGATPVSVYNTSSLEQVSAVDQACGAKMIVAESQFGEVAAAVTEKSSSIENLVSVGETFPGATKSFDDIAKAMPADLDSLASKVDASQVATLIFTSGTTGEPKGVILDHANISWTVACLRRTLKLNKYEGTKLISYLPMAHIAERIVSHYTGLLSGFQVTCCPEATDVAKYALEVRPNVLFGVPRVYEKIYAKVKVALEGENPTAAKRALAGMKMRLFSKKIQSKIGLDQLQAAVSGGAPLSPEIMQWFLNINVPMSEIYGLSETCGPMTWDPAKPKVGTVGPPCPGIEVKLADDGEIMCRGGNVFRGYLNRADLTSEVMFEGGWFATGDIGEFDSDGYLKVVDRKKEVLVTSGGKNVAPSALENSMKLSPLVSQAMAVGDNKKFISALVTLDAEAAAAWAKANGIRDTDVAKLVKSRQLISEIESQIAKLMESYSSVEQVKKIAILSEDWLPDSECLTPTSKLRRKVIAKKYEKEIDALYS